MDGEMDDVKDLSQSIFAERQAQIVQNQVIHTE